jgi:hypothetical protein
LGLADTYSGQPSFSIEPLDCGHITADVWVGAVEPDLLDSRLARIICCGDQPQLTVEEAHRARQICDASADVLVDPEPVRHSECESGRRRVDGILQRHRQQQKEVPVRVSRSQPAP